MSIPSKTPKDIDSWHEFNELVGKVALGWTLAIWKTKGSNRL